MMHKSSSLREYYYEDELVQVAVLYYRNGSEESHDLALYLVLPTKRFGLDEVIEKLDNSSDHVAVFSHNPGITEFANSLTSVHADDMPTCSIFAVKSDAKKWNDFAASKKEFWFFDYPKSTE